MSKKDAILAAASNLFWRHGYESTSPRMILDESGAGQGSLYHHFSGKADLAAEVLRQSGHELTRGLEAAFDPARTPLDRVDAWLGQPRHALGGCRVGRFAAEQEVLEHPELATPIQSYFQDVTRRLAEAFREAQAEGALPGHLTPEDLAATFVAIVQGGYVTSRATGTADAMTRAIRGARQLLRSVR